MGRSVHFLTIYLLGFVLGIGTSWSWSPTTPRPIRSRQHTHHHKFGIRLTSTPQEEGDNNNNNDKGEREWVNSALLISSFTDGVISSPEAMEFLKQGLLSVLLKERIQQTENAIADSVKFSPCAGPNIDLLNQLEELDDPNIMDQALFKALLDDENDDNSIAVRIVYIPTAMYALRSDSTNTPGKQRQRARADAKKRRTIIIDTVKTLFPSDNVEIHAVTLDLDDASIKQPTGSNDESLFPKTGKEAIREWKPHFIYVEGGNTFWLQYCMEKGDWYSDLREACVGPNAYAMYCGKSAGAIVAGTSIDTALWKGWDDPTVVPSETSYEGLGFVGNTNFFPHMTSEWEDLIQEKQTATTTTTLATNSDLVTLQDSEVCCIYGSTKIMKKISALSTAPVES